MARVRREVLKILFTYTGLCITVLLFSNIFIGPYGLEGVGFAWVIGQSLVAAVLLATDLRKAWLPFLQLPGFVKGVLEVPLRIVTTPFRNRLYRASARKVLPRVSRRLAPAGTAAPEQPWRVGRIILNSGEIRVMTLASPGHRNEVILKIPAASDALKRLKQSSAALSQLHEEVQACGWSELLPRILDEQWSGPCPYVVESMVAGRQAEGFLLDPVTRHAVLARAVEKITAFHEHTEQIVEVDEELLELWVGNHVAKIHAFTGKGTPTGQKLTELAEELRGALAGQRISTSWIHGDYSPQNILLAEDGSRITGIVDWERAGPRQLPALDVMHLLLSTRILVAKKDLGDIIHPFLKDRPVSAFEHELIYTAGLMSQNPALKLRTLTLLTWLRHTASSHSRQFSSPFWFNKNVRHVIDSAKSETASP